MRLIVNMILISALSYASTLYAPWWSITLVSAVVCLAIRIRLLQAFISGFLGVGLLWFFMAWKSHTDTQGLLSEKVTQLMGLGDPLQLIILTALIGATVSGLAAMSGSALCYHFYKRKKEYPWTYS